MADSLTWKYVAEVKETIHIFERKPNVTLKWKYEFLEM